VVRALVAFQAAYDYVDMLSEQPNADPVVNGRRLHEALLVALDPTAPQLDYYAHFPQHDDNGYLDDMIDTCRTTLSTLPSYASVATSAGRAAARIVAYQSLDQSESQGENGALARWARAETPTGTDLQWWETAASGASTLGVYALIAAAADPIVHPGDIAAIDDAYFPWIGSLHLLLDSLIDKAEDAATGQRNLIDCYASPWEAASRIRMLAVEAVRAARALPRGNRHVVILAGMMGSYLSVPGASTPTALPIIRNAREMMGKLATPTLLVFNVRRLVRRLAHGSGL
jgi:tetraprenyl-beta-curcumene synthase